MPTFNSKESPLNHPYDTVLSSDLRFLTDLIAWFVWSPVTATVAAAVVFATIVAGIPRMQWLLQGAPL